MTEEFACPNCQANDELFADATATFWLPPAGGLLQQQPVSALHTASTLLRQHAHVTCMACFYRADIHDFLVRPEGGPRRRPTFLEKL